MKMREPKILIVDDSKIDRMILKRAFDKIVDNSIELTEAADALSALQTIGSTEFDAIFLDVNMPGHNGFHVLKSLRASRSGTWPLVFMYSSSEHPDDVKQAYDEQATSYLRKPTEFSQVRDLVTSCVSLITCSSPNPDSPLVAL